MLFSKVRTVNEITKGNENMLFQYTKAKVRKSEIKFRVSLKLHT